MLDELFFFWYCGIVKDCLDSVGPLLMTANVYEVFFNHLQDPDPLLHRAVVDQFLEEVIPILILHDLGHVLAHFIEKELDHGR